MSTWVNYEKGSDESMVKVGVKYQLFLSYISSLLRSPVSRILTEYCTRDSSRHQKLHSRGSEGRERSVTQGTSSRIRTTVGERNSEEYFLG